MNLVNGTAASAALRPAPPVFDADAFFQGPYWHQRWELFQGVFVPGKHDVSMRCAAAQVPADLRGKRVLDVGAWNGCFSFECERRGAREVIAMSLEDPVETGFDRLKKALGSKVQYINGSVYSLNPEQFGAFDVILFFGVLYHLRYPLLAIDRLRSVSAGEVFVETHVIDEHPWLRRPLGLLAKWSGAKAALQSTPLWRQYREFELHANDQSNWFGPNVVAVLEAFQSAGFDIAHTKSWGNRGSFRARACAVPERLLKHTYEGYAANIDLVGLNTVEAS